MPQCTAVHMTEIQEDVQCDTYFPPLDENRWRLWSSSAQRRDNNLRYTFLCYTAVRQQETGVQLPAALNSQHEEYQA